MQKKNVLHSPKLDELKKKRKTVLRNKIIFFFSLFVIILIGLCFLSRWHRINIDNIKISGNRVVDTADIERVAEDNISAYYMWLFPKTNFLIFPKEKIISDLSSNFKRLKSVLIDVDEVKTMNIVVTEYEGKYLWCGNEPVIVEVDTDQKCYFTDSDGYIFDEAPYFSGDSYFRFYGKTDEVKEIPTGSYFRKNDFIKISSFVENLKKINLKPAGLYIQDNGDIDVYLSSDITPPGGPKIMVNIDSDFEKVIENLQSAITTDPLMSDFKNKYSSLNYIDLRFGNKVYYKFGQQIIQ